MREEAPIREALQASQQALTDWVRTHAPEFCDPAQVAESYERIAQVGTLAYIAGVNEKISQALSALTPDGASRSRGRSA